MSIFSKTRTNADTEMKNKSLEKLFFFFIAIDHSKIKRMNAEQGCGEKSLGPGFKYIRPLKIIICEEVNFVTFIKSLTAVGI